MQSFKEYLLNESLSKSDIKDKIGEWIKQQKKYFKNNRQLSAFGNYKIVDGPSGLGIDFLSKKLSLYEWMFEDGKLPFKIYSAPAVVIEHNNSMSSFENFPDNIHGNNKDWSSGLTLGSEVYDNTRVVSLEGITPIINSILNLRSFTKINYSKVDRYIKSVKIISTDIYYKGPILSFLKIKDLERVNYIVDDSKKFEWNFILNRHLQNGRDILACQDELIENGFKEYAKL